MLKTPNNTWTELKTNCNDDDKFECNMVYDTGSQYAYASAVFRFGDMGDSSNRKHWLPAPAQSGARLQLNRDGQTLRAQRAGPIANISLRI